MAENREKKLEDILKEETGNIRVFNKTEKTLYTGIAVLWAIFQLSIASYWTLGYAFQRAIHLAFAVSLIFLSVPFLKKHHIKFLPSLSQKKGIPLIDYIFIAVGVPAALYIMIAWNGIAMRMGCPNSTDIIFGLLVIVVVLEATRRAVGPALPIVCILFTLYGFFGQHLPEAIAYKGVTLTAYVSQLSLSTQGIFGIPLGVSTSIVYLFVLLGAMLDKAGAGKFFIDLALAGLGKYKGGPAKAAVVASGLTGLISGSSVANVVTTGTFTIPLMKKAGYPAKKAAAIPAFVAYFCLFFVTHLEASKLGIKGMLKEDLPNARKALKNGWHYLIPIGWLIVELIVLRHSPAMSAFRTILLLMVTILYQELKKVKNSSANFIDAIKSSINIIIEAFVAGSRNMVVVALACASAGIIVGLVATGIGSMITELVAILSGGNIYLLLIITAIASLILGMGLPTTANYIVMASLTAPVIVTIAHSSGFFVPLIAAHLFCFYFGIIADDTPPVGLAAYAAAALADTDPIPTAVQGFIYDMRTSILPFMFVFNPDLILYHVSSAPKILMIFSMAVLGSFAFASALQGWFLTKNRWYEIPFFLLAALILMNPASLIDFFHISVNFKYFMYLVGLAVLGTLYLGQKFRIRVAAAAN